jgi:hypothetical protein
LIAGVPTEPDPNPEPIVYASWFPVYHEEDDDTIEEPSELADEDYTLAEPVPVPQPALELPEESEPDSPEEYAFAANAEDDNTLVSAVAQDHSLLEWDGPRAWWIE